MARLTIRILPIFLILWCGVSPNIAFAQNAALVIIDMQPYFSSQKSYTTSDENQTKLAQIIQRERELIRVAKARNIPIVVVEYDSCGPTCEAISSEISSYAKAKKFVKRTDGMFALGSGILQPLKKFLADEKITKLVMTGANGGACVKCSIEGAINNGLEVYTDPQAVADFNEKSFVYPYSYHDGALRLRSEYLTKLRERPGLSSFDEILDAGPPGCETSFADEGTKILGR